MSDISNKLRASLVIDPDAKASVFVKTSGGSEVCLVRMGCDDLCAIADALELSERVDGLAALCNESLASPRESASRWVADFEGLRADMGTLRRDLAAEREKSARGLACIQDAIQKTEALTKERDEARARVKELEGSAEPVAWAIGGERVLAVFTDRLVAQRAWGGRAEPLYRHPPKPAGEPVAYGVEDERWAALSTRWDTFAIVDGASREVGTREQAHKAATGFREPVRIIPADAPVVDVAAIRKAIEHLVDIHAYGAVGTLRAAIGEKAGA